MLGGGRGGTSRSAFLTEPASQFAVTTIAEVAVPSRFQILILAACHVSAEAHPSPTGRIVPLGRQAAITLGQNAHGGPHRLPFLALASANLTDSACSASLISRSGSLRYPTLRCSLRRPPVTSARATEAAMNWSKAWLA